MSARLLVNSASLCSLPAGSPVLRDGVRQRGRSHVPHPDRRQVQRGSRSVRSPAQIEMKTMKGNFFFLPLTTFHCHRPGFPAILFRPTLSLTAARAACFLLSVLPGDSRRSHQRLRSPPPSSSSSSSECLLPLISQFHLTSPPPLVRLINKL